MARATVLLAHGSRDPEWRRPIEAVAARMQELAPQAQVHCAYLELTPPDLACVIDELALAGIAEIIIVPMLLGLGRHARQDLPQRVQQLALRHPTLALQLRPAIGEDLELIDLLARMALR